MEHHTEFNIYIFVDIYNLCLIYLTECKLNGGWFFLRFGGVIFLVVVWYIVDRYCFIFNSHVLYQEQTEEILNLSRETEKINKFYIHNVGTYI